MANPDYVALAQQIGALVAEKNAAYGSSFSKCGEFLRLLYPDGLKPEQYRDALLIVRIFDKLMRIATAKDALGENPYRDIAGYGLLGAAEHGEPKASANTYLDSLIDRFREAVLCGKYAPVGGSDAQ